MILPKSVLLIFIVVAAAACGAKDESYTYDLTENGCATGAHTFSSKSDMCNALKDDSVNNGCASGLRQQKIQSDCG